MQVGFVHLNSIKQIHRNEDTTSMQSASSFLNDSDHKNNNTFFFFLESHWKPRESRACSTVHICIVCFTQHASSNATQTVSIEVRTERGKSAENVHFGVSFPAEAVMSSLRWLWPGSQRGWGSSAKPSPGSRRSDQQICWQLRSPRSRVCSSSARFFSVALRSSCRHMVALPDSPRAAPVQPHWLCLLGRRARPAANANTPWAHAHVP